MSDSFDSWVRGVMSGERRGIGAAALRTTLRAIEPAYSGIATVRNSLFDRGIKRTHRLDRPVISVGNLTTGGTGKTPFVQWLVRELRTLGQHPAILMRGYARTDPSSESDEEHVLRESLPGTPVYATPNRVDAGRRAVAEQPAISLFVLDDGFQHRRLARDLDIVLIDATNPFGYEHVLPRGMLRELPSGLARANLVVVTRIERVSTGQVDEIERRVRQWIAPGVTVVRAPYAMDDVRVSDEPAVPLAALAGRSALALCAIGNPQAFEDGLTEAGVNVVARRRFADHHAYTQSDLDAVERQARRTGADLILTTEKDWAKLRELTARGSIGRVGVRVLPTATLRDAVEPLITKITTVATPQ